MDEDYWSERDAIAWIRSLPKPEETPDMPTTTAKTRYYRIVRNGHGMGGFLAPPAHHSHAYVLASWGNKAAATRYGMRSADTESLTYALTDPALPDATRAEVAAFVARNAGEVASAPNAPSPLWVADVYGYFRNSYSPDGTTRDVSRAVIYHPAPDGQPQPVRPPAEHHMGYLCVREYFPDHAPDLALIADPGKGYGSYPCEKCGQRVQYEARLDALAVFGQNTGDCPQGGQHSR